MKNRLMVALLLGTLIASAQSLVAADGAKGCNCPVSGREAKTAQAAEYLGNSVYFCCGNCKKAFEADPDKYAAKAKAQMLCTGQIEQVACPLSGGKAKEGITVSVEGQPIAFCCKKCQAKVQNASADEQLELVFGNLDKGFKSTK